MIPALLLTAALFAASDSPTTPVDSTTLLTLIASGNPVVGEACDSYRNLTGTMYDFITAAGGDSQTLDVFTDVVDAYLIVTVEGDEFRLTPEARLVFVDWLHAGLRVDEDHAVIFNVKDYGAFGDGVHNDSAAFIVAIAAAQAAATEDDPSILEVPKGEYNIRPLPRDGS